MSRGEKTELLDEVPAFSRQTLGGIFLAIKGPDRGESVALRPGRPIYFGSSPDCEMALSDKTVSRRHLMAVLDGDQVILRDQGSTNGTFIQGSRFKEITIGYGAEFKLGQGDAPTLNARDTGHCMGSNLPCYFSNSPVALQGARGPGEERNLCFANGAGKASGDTGVVVRCTDDVEYALPMPEAAVT